VTYFEELQKRVEETCKCEAIHEQTVSVTETYGDRIVWMGDVQVFRLNGNPKAKVCYAWGHPIETGPREITTVLEIPPVRSAADAVRVAVASHARNR
jgi:hypothetical protein